MLLSFLFSRTVDAQTLPYSCTSAAAECNLIKNGGFEEGSQTTALRGVARHYAECWDINDSVPYLCQTIGTQNTPDILDATVSCTQYTGCDQGIGACVGIPISFISDNEVNIRPGGSGNRYAHMITAEQMHNELALPTSNKIYWLNLWAAPASCISHYYSKLCVKLVKTSTGQSYSAGTLEFFDLYSIPGEWRNPGICINLESANPFDFDKISFQFTEGDESAYDDFQLVQLADAGEDATVCQGTPAELGECCIDGAIYSWAPATGLSCTDCCNPVATPSATTTYTVTVTSPDGSCTATDQVTITVNPAANAFAISGNVNSCDPNGSAYTISNATPGFTYCWTATNGSPSSGSFTYPAVSTVPIYFADDGFLTITACPTGGTCPACPCPVAVTFEVFECCASKQYPALDNAFSQTVWGNNVSVSNATYYINNVLTFNSSVTFYNTVFKMAPHARIIILNGQTLTLDQNSSGGCIVEQGCEGMWDTIRINEEGNLVVRHGTIRDGITAVFSKDGGNYILESNTLLEKNYKNIVVAPYPNTHNGIIRNTMITGSASLPYPPYLNQQSYSGVEAYSVTGLTVGDAATSTNKVTMQTLRYGIIASNSSVTAKNLDVLNLLTSLLPCHSCQCPIGTGICAYTTEVTPRTLTVGGAGANDKVTFQQSSHGATGIHANGRETVNATYNLFDNVKTGASLNNIPSTFTLNLSNNTFKSFTFGIVATNLSYNDVTIAENDFNVGVTSGTIGTAIKVQNVNSAPIDLSITNNDIERVKTGIHLVKLISSAGLLVNVYNNDIDFTQLTGATVTGNYYGIRLQNCYGNEVESNTISKPGSSPSQSTVQKLRGISFENSQTSHIFRNELTKMGSGIYGLGACNASKLECNEFTSCYEGFYFSNANIGNQIAPNIFTNNQWHSYLHFKIAGEISASTWYYDNSNSLFNPFPQGCMNMSFSPTGSANPLCNAVEEKLSDENDSSTVRDEMLEEIVNASNEHEVENGEWLKVWDEQFAYQMLSEDSSWLDLNNEKDEFYQQYFDSISSTNTAWMAQSAAAINNLDFISAKFYNDQILPGNEIEKNRKTVNEILLSLLPMESPQLDSTQIETLELIAISDPVLGGEAVYSARVLLNLDPDETVKYEPVDEQDQTDLDQWLSVFPNPNSGQFTAHCLIETHEANLRIYTTSGMLLFQIPIEGEKLTVDVSHLSAGFYVIVAAAPERPSSHSKLSITK
jgi:parallel beta-helix repeat protein